MHAQQGRESRQHRLEQWHLYRCCQLLLAVYLHPAAVPPVTRLGEQALILALEMHSAGMHMAKSCTANCNSKLGAVSTCRAF